MESKLFAITTGMMCLLLAMQLTHGKRWREYEYPDPLDPSSNATDKCNTTLGYICDPAGTLTVAEEEELRDLIDQMRASLGCECQQCSSQKRRFKLFLAMVPGMLHNDGTVPLESEEAALAKDFTDHLRINTYSEHDDCDNTVVAMFNTVDRQIYTSTGMNVRKNTLSNECVQEIFEETVPLVKDEWYPGVSYMLKQYLDAAEGKRDCETKDSEMQWWEITLIVLAVVIPIFLLCGCCIYCIRTGSCEDGGGGGSTSRTHGGGFSSSSYGGGGCSSSGGGGCGGGGGGSC